jgi:hypothetical protein
MDQKTAEDWQRIRAPLVAAQIRLGASHPSTVDIKTVENNLTPGHADWHGDPVMAKGSLAVLINLLEKTPEHRPLIQVPGSREMEMRKEPEFPRHVSESIDKLKHAIRLLEGKIKSLGAPT